jgi:hypothetical protein
MTSARSDAVTPLGESVQQLHIEDADPAVLEARGSACRARPPGRTGLPAENASVTFR